MSDPLIRECDNYVVLEPGEKEKILNVEETLSWLADWIEKIEKLPKDLEDETSAISAANHLLDTACNLEIKNGFIIQWFAVRLNPPEI